MRTVGRFIPDTVDKAEDTPIDKMTVSQLRDYAKKRGIDIGGAKLKEDILALILAEG